MNGQRGISDMKFAPFLRWFTTTALQLSLAMLVAAFVPLVSTLVLILLAVDCNCQRNFSIGPLEVMSVWPRRGQVHPGMLIAFFAATTVAYLAISHMDRRPRTRPLG